MKILRRRAVEEVTGLSRSTLYAMMADGWFPRPIRLGKRAVGCHETEMLNWLQSRTDAS